MLKIREIYAHDFDVDENTVNILGYTDLWESNQSHEDEDAYNNFYKVK